MERKDGIQVFECEGHPGILLSIYPAITYRTAVTARAEPAVLVCVCVWGGGCMWGGGEGLWGLCVCVCVFV